MRAALRAGFTPLKGKACMHACMHPTHHFHGRAWCAPTGLLLTFMLLLIHSVPGRQHSRAGSMWHTSLVTVIIVMKVVH